MMKSTTAYLTNSDRYSRFTVGDICIKFRTSPYLQHYDSVKKWNNGYMVCMASYSTLESPIEEYIDLRYIADRLSLPKDFFKEIKEVKIR